MGYVKTLLRGWSQFPSEVGRKRENRAGFGGLVAAIQVGQPLAIRQRRVLLCANCATSTLAHPGRFLQMRDKARSVYVDLAGAAPRVFPSAVIFFSSFSRPFSQACSIRGTWQPPLPLHAFSPASAPQPPSPLHSFIEPQS